jgi:serine-type D-Ala-D-Ala carboxypeptidase (penicillin-binding protein 5/6)
VASGYERFLRPCLGTTIAPQRGAIFRQTLLERAPQGPCRVDAREGHGHDRVAQGPELERPGLTLPRAPWNGEAARGTAEGEDALGGGPLVPAPDEDAGRTELEAPQAPDLDLQGALDAADALWLHLSSLLVHAPEDSLRDVPKHVAVTLAAVVLAALLGSAGARGATPPSVEARAVLVADGRTGDILYERNADARMAMASITKLMTAIVTLEHAAPGETVRVSPQAIGRGGSSIFLTAGERLRVRELLAAALIQSANDAAFALAADVGDGSLKRFVGMMNAKAAELGLDGTTYVRPDGLDVRGHVSTARDTFELARLAMREPLIRELVRKRKAQIPPDRTLKSWNDLLWTFPGMIGVKTGHTDRAGWAEVAAARRGPTTVYAVVLGSPSRERRNADLTKLLEWGFDRWARYTVVHKGERYATASVPFAEDEPLELVAAAGASELVRLDDGTQFVERVVAPEMVDLPVSKGEKLGEIVVTKGDAEVARVDLVAARDVPEPSFQERVGWYADRALDEAGDILATVIPGL